MHAIESHSTLPADPTSMSSSIAEFIQEQVPDWDDEEVSAARFKAFSGQRSDWQSKFAFWRDLILKVARHLGVFVIDASEAKAKWFARAGLTPLCIDHVLLEMYSNGEIIPSQSLVDPTSGHLYKVFRRFAYFLSIGRSSKVQELPNDRLILKTLLQERADDVIKVLSESYWTSSCIVTMQKFRNICKGTDEALIILSYLFERGKAVYLSSNNGDIQGVKISLVPAAVPSLSSLDRDILHLICTIERLQQQLQLIDLRCEASKKLALDFLKMGNKPTALRHMRQLKLSSENRAKSAALLNRVEEVLEVIMNAEATKKVSEAIQIGTRAIKENGISAEEVRLHLAELDECIVSQKQVEEEIASTPLGYNEIEDDGLEEEFRQLEIDLSDQTPTVQMADPVAHATTEVAESEDSAESLSQTLIHLSLEAA